jgi:hypothetical protein
MFEPYKRLKTAYRQFVVDLSQNVVFVLKDDVTGYGLRVKKRNHPTEDPHPVTRNTQQSRYNPIGDSLL